MVAYLCSDFPEFGREAAYCSLIFSKTSKGSIRFSGRGWSSGQEFRAAEMLTFSTCEIRRESAWAKPAALLHSRNEYRARFEQTYVPKASLCLLIASVT